MSYSIMLDAGHGGRDPGAVYNGRREKDDTLSLTLAIGELLQEHGIDVLYTRTTDIYESPYQKALEANAAGADFFLSIHRNSYPTDNTVSGVESLVYNKSGLKYTRKVTSKNLILLLRLMFRDLEFDLYGAYDISEEDIQRVKDSLDSVTSENKEISMKVMLKVRGERQMCDLKLHTLWSSLKTDGYIGIVGQLDIVK